MEGVRDWSLYELEKFAGYESINNDDHIVPYQVTEQVNGYVVPGDIHKKQRYVENVEKCMDRRGSASRNVLQGKEETYLCAPMEDETSTILEGSQAHASEDVVPASCDLNFVVSASAFACPNARFSVECFNDCNVDTVSNILCPNNSIPGSWVSADGTRSCSLLLDDIPPSATDLSYFGDENKNREKDLVYYDLPDIGNFEDIDRIFRNCDVTFGQGRTGTADELSWFSSSSNTFYGSEVTFESGLQSSCSELSPLNHTSAYQGAHINFLTKSDQPMDTNAKKDKGDCAAKDQNNIHHKKKGNQSLSEENKMQQFRDKMLLSSASCAEAGPSKTNSKQKHPIGASSSSYVLTSNNQGQIEYDHSVHQCPQTTSRVQLETNPSSSYTISDNIINNANQCMERLTDQIYKAPIVTTGDLEKLPHKDQICAAMTSENMHQPAIVTTGDLEKLPHRDQICAAMMAENMHQPASFLCKSSVQERCHNYQHGPEINRTVENIHLESAVEVNSPRVQESSCMTSFSSDDISLEVTSFQQLQFVIYQLDIRTKLCIRDSLYRLARSSNERHDFNSTNNCNKVNNYASGSQSSEAPKKCEELMDAETVTNPVDRSIAHLLFTGLPQPTACHLSP